MSVFYKFIRIFQKNRIVIMTVVKNMHRSTSENGKLKFIMPSLILGASAIVTGYPDFTPLPDKSMMPKVTLTSHERRFLKFASVEFNGQIFMTPEDFLESILDYEQNPRYRPKRRILTETEMEQIKNCTPALDKGSPQMFRNLRDKGVISYTEYLFLLSILTKPTSGFMIAFNMFDTDGNKQIDKNEFLIVRSLLIGKTREEIEEDEELSEAVSS